MAPVFNQGHFHCLIEGPAMSEYVDYLNVKERNRKGFELNFGSDISAFQASFSALRSIWERLGTTRDVSGQSQVGLLVFANILIRHSILKRFSFWVSLSTIPRMQLFG
jgi:hypothetical protein